MGSPGFTFEEKSPNRRESLLGFNTPGADRHLQPNFFSFASELQKKGKMSGKAKETASNTMEAIRKKMLSLKGSKEASADTEKSLQNRVVELDNLLKARDDEILDTDLVTTEGRLTVESAKLAEAAAAAEAVEIQRKTLESKSFINDEKIDNLDERIVTAQGIALI